MKYYFATYRKHYSYCVRKDLSTYVCTYTRLFHLLERELEKVRQLVQREHGHRLALGLDALCDCYFL